MSRRYQGGFVTASYNGLQVPNAPTIGTATAGGASASVTFTAPSNVGGGAITSYTAISSPGGITGTSASSPITVSGLTNGTAYTFTVVATNIYGSGPASAASNSVTPVPYWIATLGDRAGTTDAGFGIAIDSLGNTYVAGTAASQGAGGDDGLVAKYNAAGVIQWQRVLGDTGADALKNVAVDSSGNAYVSGFTQVSGTAGILVAKYNTSGTIQWQRTLNDAVTEDSRAITVDSSGNVYITGFTSSQGAGSFDAFVAKYDTSGTLQWQRILGGASFDFAVGIAVDSSANVYITGYTQSQGQGNYDVLIAKYDTSGTIQWQRILGGASADLGFGIALDSSENVIVAGRNSGDALITQYNTSGTIQWQRTLGGAGSEAFNGVAVDSSGNLYAVGTSDDFGSTGIIIAKYNNAGTIQWQRGLNTSTEDSGVGIRVDNLGNYYIIGNTNKVDPGGQELLIAKLPTDGSLTGTYSDFTYLATSFTVADPNLTAATSTLTAATSTLTAATSTLTSATSTLTSVTITI